MADNHLPPGMAALRADLAPIVAGMARSAPYAAAWLSARQGLRITVDSREERVAEAPPVAGTVLTVYDGATLHERAVGGFDRAAIERAGRELARGITVVPGPAIDPGPERRGDFVTPLQIAPASLSTAEKLERCRDLQRRLAALDPRIVNASANYTESSEYAVFGNRAADLAQHVQRVRMFVLVAVEGPDGVRYNWSTKTGTGGWEALTYSDEELAAVVGNALALLTAERIEPGPYTVIAAPAVVGTIVHESFGHGVETDMFLKERAKAAGYIDRVVGSPLVDIWDDPSYPGAYGSYFFDDEGMLAAPTQIVEHGIFRRGITDLYSASMLGLPRSANGRRQDYTRKAYARMTTTAFGRGATPVADLFAQVEDGIYLEKWSSGMEDPKGWGIQVTCHFGHEIKHGRVTERMVAPVGISGYVPDVLQSVTAVGDDWAADGGTCGKGHKESVPVSSGGPHLLLKARLG
jgi:TldD protein